MEPVNAGKFGQSKRMHKDVDTKGENISFPGEDGRKESRQRRELCYQQAKGSLVRSDSWHKEKRKSKIKQESIEALHSRGGFHSFPGHCAVQRARPGQRNLPSLIPSFPLFLPSLPSLFPPSLSQPPSAALALQAQKPRAHSPPSTCVKQPKSSSC